MKFGCIEAPNVIMYVAVDVSGHGFDAALIMALTRPYMSSRAPLGMDVEDVLPAATDDRHDESTSVIVTVTNAALSVVQPLSLDTVTVD